jgi:hypothetical protein
MRRWWREIVSCYELDSHHLLQLQAVAESFDRMVEARERLAVDGAVYVDRFGAPRKHPSVSIEENARLAMLRALRELALDDSVPPDFRPPRIGNPNQRPTARRR